jgi:hypothetical protein
MQTHAHAEETVADGHRLMRSAPGPSSVFWAPHETPRRSRRLNDNENMAIVMSRS